MTGLLFLPSTSTTLLLLSTSKGSGLRLSQNGLLGHPRDFLAAPAGLPDRLDDLGGGQGRRSQGMGLEKNSLKTSCIIQEAQPISPLLFSTFR